jgi:hypothetical protein
VSGVLRTTLSRGFRRTALPLVSYYAVTLALPFANGAAQSGTTFVKHAIMVFVVPPIVTVLACTVYSIRRICQGFASCTDEN